MNNIFENIESEKRIELNDRLWQRVEDKLDVNKYRSKSNNYRWVAVCAILVLALGFVWHLQDTPQRSKYRVTDFSIDGSDSNIKATSTDKSTLQKFYNNAFDCLIKGDKFSC